MKILTVCLIAMTFYNAQANELDLTFQNNFHEAIEKLNPDIKQVSYKKYTSFCDPSAIITTESGDEINASCGFARVGCSLENCNKYELDYDWYSFKKYKSAAYDEDGVMIIEAEIVPEFYETIMMFKKPSKELIQIEINKILFEKQRIVDWKNRVLKIKDARVLLQRCGNEEINGQSVLNRIHQRKNAEDLILLNCIEAERVKFDSENAIKKVKSEKIRIGIAIRTVCQSAIDLIVGWNVGNNLTDEQLDTMQSKFAETEKALKSSRPKKAKKLILSIIADGIIIKKEMKIEVLEILDTILVQK